MTFTVTATASGGGSINGTAMQVLALTSAAEGGGASAALSLQGTSATLAVSLTTAASGSLPVYAIQSYPANPASALAANNALYGTPVEDPDTSYYSAGHYTGTVTNGTPVTLGLTTPGQYSALAAYEIEGVSGSPVQDASTPAFVATTGAQSVTTASFAPPAGSVLVALVTSNGNDSGSIAIAMSDTSGLGLTWTQRAIASTGSVGSQAAVFTATMPPAPPLPVAYALQPPGRRSPMSMRATLPPPPASNGAASTIGYRGGNAGFSATSPFTLTIPATVQAGDILLVYGSVFSDNTEMTLSGTVNTPTQFYFGHNGVNDSFMVWAVTAAAADAGATLTFTETGVSTYVGGIILAYYGAGMPVAANANGGFDNSNTSAWPAPVTAPSPVSGCWGVYFITAGVGGGDGFATYAGGAVREQDSASGANSCDSNGSIGPGGSSVGGGVWTTQANGPTVGITVILPPAGNTASASDGDTAGAADAVTLAASVPAADDAGAIDGVVIASSAPVADAAGADDSISIVVTVGLADAAGSDDADAVPALGVPEADAAGSADAVAVPSVSLPLADVAGSGEALAATVTVPPADAAGGVESLAVSALVSLADEGGAFEDAASGAPVPQADAAAAGDAVSASATVPLAEVAGAAEKSVVTIAAPLADQGAAADALAVSVIIPLGDAGGAADRLVQSPGAMASLSAGATLSASARVTRLARASCAALPIMGAAGHAVKIAVAPLSASPALSGSGQSVKAVGASLAATPTLSATGSAGPDSDALWVIYQRLYAVAETAAMKWNRQRQAGGSGAMAGQLYGAAYEAERQAAVAYRAYLAALRASRPGAGG